METAKKPATPLHAYLACLHQKHAPLTDGQVADYIPELSNANPDHFGIAIVTVDGHVYQVGDTLQPFSIQSISKAILYGLALTDKGIDYVTQRVSVEPSGDAFNSISLDPITGQPLNPMINAGAIATTAMIEANTEKTAIERILDYMSHFVGHPLEVNERVYQSESQSGHRNRAISHMLRNFEIVDDNHHDALETYFKQCSINVTCQDLALMAGCLANNGINPITGVEALKHRYVDKVLSVMSSCGMYDYSGNWLFRVGMPAKSGVGGGILAVLPGQFGLAVYSPPLDAFGNSVRGIKVCEDISADFGLHIFQGMRSTSASILRVKFYGSKVRSHKFRHNSDHSLLNQLGARICGFELQGELMLASSDSVIRQLLDELDDRDYFIVDCKHVVSLDYASQKLILDLIYNIHSIGKHIFLSGLDSHFYFLRFLKQDLSSPLFQTVTQFFDREHALQWSEDDVLRKHSNTKTPHRDKELGEQPLCEGLTTPDLETLKALCKEIHLRPNEILFERGQQADTMYFIKSGMVEAYINLDHRREKRLSTLNAGMTFGELAMLNENKRTANIRALEDTVCYELAFSDINDRIRTTFLANLARILVSKVENETREIEAMY